MGGLVKVIVWIEETETEETGWASEDIGLTIPDGLSEAFLVLLELFPTPFPLPRPRPRGIFFN